jgi:hypothetical protein
MVFWIYGRLSNVVNCTGFRRSLVARPAFPEFFASLVQATVQASIKLSFELSRDKTLAWNRG